MFLLFFTLKNKIKFQNNTNYKKKIYIFFFTALSKIFKIRFFLKNLGISKYKIILLNFKLKQFPFFWLPPEYETANVDLKKRKDFFYKESLKKNFNIIEKRSLYSGFFKLHQFTFTHKKHNST